MNIFWRLEGPTDDTDSRERSITSKDAWEAVFARGLKFNRHPFSKSVSLFYWSRPVPGNGPLSALDVCCGDGVLSNVLALHGFWMLDINFSTATTAVAFED